MSSLQLTADTSNQFEVAKILLFHGFGTVLVKNGQKLVQKYHSHPKLMPKFGVNEAKIQNSVNGTWK